MIVKACPFCGGKPYLEESQRGFVDGKSTKVCYVRCKNCNARSSRVNLADYHCSSYSADAIAKVIESWNKRVESVQEFEITGHRKNKVAEINMDEYTQWLNQHKEESAVS